jgi:hypothetical protein
MNHGVELLFVKIHHGLSMKSQCVNPYLQCPGQHQLSTQLMLSTVELGLLDGNRCEVVQMDLVGLVVVEIVKIVVTGVYLQLMALVLLPQEPQEFHFLLV